jgi:amino acid transporter
MTMIVSLSMAEICSAYPSAGSVYHWTAQVVPEKYAAVWSYTCGWFNYLGNSAGDAAFAYSFAQQMNAAIELSGGSGYSDKATSAVAIAILLLWSLLNILRIDKVGFMNNFAAFSQGAVIVILLLAVLIVPDRLATADYVFTKYYNDTGFKSKSYVVCIGLLTSLFSFAGYEASAHMAEETTQSRIVAPRGIIMTCFATGLGGIIIVLGLLFSTPSVETILDGPTDSAAINVFVLQCGSKWGQALSWLVVYILFFAGVSSVAVTGRITYALMRDRAFPYADYWSQVHPYFQTPLHAIMFVALFDFVLLLIPLGGNNGTAAFASITALTTIGFQVSYALPILLKVIYQPKDFPLTPFHLGIWSVPLGIISCIWLLGTTCLFFFPTSYPITAKSMNWVIVVVFGCAIILALNWQYNSQYSFKGPPRHKEQHDLLPTSDMINLDNLSRRLSDKKTSNKKKLSKLESPETDSKSISLVSVAVQSQTQISNTNRTVRLKQIHDEFDEEDDMQL